MVKVTTMSWMSKKKKFSFFEFDYSIDYLILKLPGHSIVPHTGQ